MTQPLIIRRSGSLLIAALIVWLIYTGLYIYSKHAGHSVIAGLFPLIGEAGLDLVAAVLAYLIWIRTKTRIALFFLLLFIAFIAAFMADGTYNILLNIRQFELTTFVDSLFDLPFAIFLFIQLIAWIVLFNRGGSVDDCKRVEILPYLIAAVIIFVSFMFGVKWKIEHLSIIGLYQMADTLFEVFGFVFALFCLVRANVNWVRYLSIGYLIVIGTDFMIRYSVIQQHVLLDNPLETSWVLGLIVIVLGLLMARHHDQDKMVLTNITSMSSKTGMWMFKMGLIVVFLFLIVAATISAIGGRLRYFDIGLLPPVIIVFSIALALISNQIALRIRYEDQEK